MTEPVIEVRDLWFSFNGQPVLSGVNLTVPRGDFLIVIGPNGGGKTTLLKLMLGLYTPRRGSVAVFGEPPRRVSQRIGYVPQNVHINKDFPVSVLAVVLMGRLRASRGWSRHSREDRRAAQEAMEQMRVWDYRDRRIGELSGGQLQRVFIARALVSAPEILFLDEAMASIDAQSRGEFHEALQALNRTVTIVAVSHDLMILSSHVKSVACVNGDLYHHDSGEITREMLDAAYHCPVDLVAHGVPHRVLGRHEEKRKDD
ncbi:MAG: metal ABC transporter ATP-binding protein [Deltaproteobacteria bacterium]|nr:metal ABC transporter ATP-binding protein [Deltaproteobacteria bacterium]